MYRSAASAQTTVPSGSDQGCKFLLGRIVQVGIDVRYIAVLFRKLGVAVEQMDRLHFISEEGNPVRIIVCIGEYVDNRPTDRILSWGGYEVDPFESLPGQFLLDRVERNLHAFFQPEDFLTDERRRRYLFFKCFRVCDKIKRTVFGGPLHQFSDRRSPLDAQR